MADGSIIVDTELDVDGFRRGSKELQTAVKSLNSQVDRLGPTLKKGLAGSTAAMSEFNSKSSGLEQTISDIERSMQVLAGARLPTEEYAKVCTELEQVSKRFDDLYAKQEKFLATGGSTDSQQWRSMQYDMDLVSDRYHELLRLKRELETGGKAFTFGRDTTQYSALEAGLREAKETLQEMTDEANEASGAVAGIATSAKKLPGFLRKALTATKKLISANRSYKNSFGGVLQQVKRIAPALLAAEGVLGILRKAVNAYMDSNQQLASTLNSCWSGIGNLLGPIITRMVNLIASAVAYFTAFLKLLGFTGGAAVEAIGGAGGAAKKETDKLKRQLASFDDLNILSDSSSEDGGGGGGSADTTLAEKELPDWAKRMAEQINSGDWKGAALTLTNKLNELVDNADWEGMGQKLGYGLNAALTFLAAAITNFDWVDLGSGLATMLNNILYSVDWANLGIVLGAGLLAALGMLHGFVSAFDWAAFGKAIADAFMGLWTSIDWAMAAQTVNMGIIGVLTTLITAVQGFDWQQIGRDVATFLTGINWGEIFANLGKLLWELLKAAFEFVGGMIEGGGLTILLGAFGILLGGLTAKVAATSLWSGVTKALTTAVSNLLKGIVGAEGIGAWGPKILAAGKTLLGTIIGKAGGIVTKVLPAITGALGNILSGVVAAIGGWPTVVIAAAAAGLALLVVWLKNGGADVVHGFFQGIYDAISGVADWISNNIFKPFINGFKAAFGIHSPSTVMKEQGGYIIEGLLLGLKEAWASIGEFFSTALSDITTALSEGWTAVKTDAAEKWSEIKTAIGEAWTDIKSNAKDTNENIKSHASAVWSDVKKNITSRLSEAKASAAAAWSNMQKKAASTGSNIKSDVNSVWSDVKKNISDKLSEAKTSAAGHWDNIKSKAAEIGSAVSKKASEDWQSVKSNITTYLGNARDAASPIWDSIKSKVETVGPQIVSSVVSAWSDVKSKITTYLGNARDEAVIIWNNMSSQATGIHTAIKTSLGGIWGEMKTTLTSKASDISSGITQKFNELKTDAFTWGRHICENIANGIDTFNYKVKDAAKRLGQKIKDFVGFSEPKEGPLSNFHTYMPDMIDLMVEGIEGEGYRAVKAVAAMTQSMSDEIQSGDYGIKPIVNTTRGLSQMKALAASPVYRTPAVATGELLPYQVTAKLVGMDEGVKDAVLASSAELQTTLVRVIMEAATAVVTALQQQGRSGTVDTDTMTNMIIDEINRRTRSMGRSPLL